MDRALRVLVNAVDFPEINPTRISVSSRLCFTLKTGLRQKRRSRPSQKKKRMNHYEIS